MEETKITLSPERIEQLRRKAEDMRRSRAGDDYMTCPDCEGKGAFDEDMVPDDTDDSRHPCYVCRGTGRVRRKKDIGAITAAAQRAIVNVGEGRGFVMNTYGRERVGRIIVTAAHCLPHFPPCAAFVTWDERTYGNLVGGLTDEQRSITVELLFADPVADIAVLAGPDNQAMGEASEAYEAFTENAGALVVGSLIDREPEDAWVLSLDGVWLHCRAESQGGGLWLTNVGRGGIEGGMSGSPILNEHGEALGVIGTGSSISERQCDRGGPQARLSHHLPGWLLRVLALQL